MDEIDINTDSTLCFCFDRDSTIHIGKWPGPVPIEWVEYISENTDHEVWATGNPKLEQEASIPGMDDILSSMPNHKSILHRNAGRKERLKLVREYIDADEYIVVDDVDVSNLEGFNYYSPSTFVNSVPDFFWEISKPKDASEYALDYE